MRRELRIAPFIDSHLWSDLLEWVKNASLVGTEPYILLSSLLDKELKKALSKDAGYIPTLEKIYFVKKKGPIPSKKIEKAIITAIKEFATNHGYIEVSVYEALPDIDLKDVSQLAYLIQWEEKAAFDRARNLESPSSLRYLIRFRFKFISLSKEEVGFIQYRLYKAFPPLILDKIEKQLLDVKFELRNSNVVTEHSHEIYIADPEIGSIVIPALTNLARFIDMYYNFVPEQCKEIDYVDIKEFSLL